MVNFVKRPANIDGCWSAWAERDQAQFIRTQMESGKVKVRRRTTGVHRTAEVSVTLKAELYDDFMHWFRVLCQAGDRKSVV